MSKSEQTGSNYHKNRATRESRKRRKRLERATHLHISSNLGEIRTLRRSARNELRRKKARGSWIMPWSRDILWKRQQRNYPEGHLLSLPAELRQDILRMSLGEEDLQSWISIYATVGIQARAQKLAKRTAELSCVSPVIRLDMIYVGEQWRKDYLVVQPAVEEYSVKMPEWRSKVLEMKWKERGRIGIQVHAREQNAKTRRSRNRRQKCWHCDERHKESDPVCPMERRDPERWKKLTKVLKERDSKACRVFKGEKVVFKD